MIREHSDFPSRSRAERIKLRIGHQTRDLTADEALALAYSLVQSKKYQPASQIADLVARRNGSNSRVAILQAYCAAGRNDYAACNVILREAFAEAAVAERLQAAFVYLSLGLKVDAARELDEIAGGHAELPTVCLLLGDLLAVMGQTAKAAIAWKLAIQRDHRGGSAALTAHKRLNHIENEHPLHQ
ncbi:MAG: tetratricopeptide repeat protein [Pirellulales bacterium]